MTSDNLIDRWLDLWEELAEHNESPTEAEFIAEHCQQGSPDEIEQFRVQLKRLQAMNAKVANAMPSDSAASVSTNSGDRKSTQAPDRRLRPGAEPIPGYVLQSKLGQGGFGQVWKATAPGGHEVALKFIKLERRVGEAEQRALDVMKNVRHPHLLSYHGSWQVGKALVIAMDLADGTLADRLDEAIADGNSGMPTAELLGYMLEAAKGIDYLNENRHPGHDGRKVGIQHRDIKPQNILLQGGSVKVADFGLARFVEHSVTGHTGSMTPAYAAPESFDHQTSSQSDQYSLAVTYLQMRTGELPFTGTPMQVMHGHLNAKPDLTGLPEVERTIVERALAKDPADRWASCREFVKKLIAAIRGKPKDSGKNVSNESPKSDSITSAALSRHQQELNSTIFQNKGIVAGVVGVVALLICVVVVQQSQVAVPSQDVPRDDGRLGSGAPDTGIESGQQASIETPDANTDETVPNQEVTDDKPEIVVAATDNTNASESTAPTKPVKPVDPQNSEPDKTPSPPDTKGRGQPTTAKLLGVTKIWSQAPDNAFTDLIYFKDHFVCAFREAASKSRSDGTLRILRSSSGNQWESIATIRERGVDLRDPRLSITPDGRLMIVCGSVVWNSLGQMARQQSRVIHSADGESWTEPTSIASSGYRSFGVDWHEGTAYGMFYFLRSSPKGKRKAASNTGLDSTLTLFSSSDGLQFQKGVRLDVDGGPSEATVRFLREGTMIALVRRSQGIGSAWIGSSEPPYSAWQWHDTHVRLAGANFIRLPNGELWCAARDYDGVMKNGRTTRTVVSRISANSYSHVLELPSSGDTGYPGLVWKDDILWITYYSSHEGKAVIYLAKVSLPIKDR